MPSTIENLATEIETLRRRLERVQPYTAATVTAYNRTTGVATLADPNGVVFSLIIPTSGPTPSVGTTILLGTNRGDAVILSKAGSPLTVESPTFDGTTPGAGDATTGWMIHENGDAWFGNVFVRGKVEATEFTALRGPNRCSNPGFEVDTAGWASADTLTRDTVTVRTGVGAGLVTATATGGAGFYGPSVPCKPGEAWTIKAYVRGTTGRNVKHFVRFLDAAFAATDIEISSRTLSSTTWDANFQITDYVAVAPANAAYVLPLIEMQATAIGDVMRLDDVDMYRVPLFTGSLRTAMTGRRLEILDGAQVKGWTGNVAELTSSTVKVYDSFIVGGGCAVIDLVPGDFGRGAGASLRVGGRPDTSGEGFIWFNGVDQVGEWPAFATTVGQNGWYQGAAGNLFMNYHMIGTKTCTVVGYLKFGATPLVGGGLILTMQLPFVAANKGSVYVGPAFIGDSGVRNYLGIATVDPNQQYAKFRHTEAGSLGDVTSTAPFTWGVPDFLAMSLTYEIA